MGKLRNIIALFWNFGISIMLLSWRKHKIWTSFKTLGSKKVVKWRLKKFQSNDKLSRKVMSFSYHIEWKTFTETSLENRLFADATFKGLWVVSCKKTRGILRSVWVLFFLLEIGRQKKYRLREANSVCYRYLLWCDEV